MRNFAIFALFLTVVLGAYAAAATLTNYDNSITDSDILKVILAVLFIGQAGIMAAVLSLKDE